MRTLPRRRSPRMLTALVASGLAVAVAVPAHADLIDNDLDDSVTAFYELMPLSLSVGAETTDLSILAVDNDNDAGCNFDGAGETLTIELTSSVPGVASVHPTSMTFSACNAPQTLTVTPHMVGAAEVTATIVANSTRGGFNVNTARFKVDVNAVPNTPPTLDIVGVEEDGEYAKGTLARPSCVATDPDDFPVAPHTKTWLAPLTVITGPYAVDNIGVRYAMCSYTDQDGVQVLARKGFTIVDDSAPVIQRVWDPSADGTGWFRETVTLSHDIFENQSPSSLQPPTGCEPVTVDYDTRLKTVTCSATSAGGTNILTTHIRRDATAPVVNPISTVVSGTVGQNGWYTSPVGVSFTATDPTSSFLTSAGTVSTTSSQTATSESEGAAVVVGSPVFTDRVGNSSVAGAVSSAPVKVDLTGPSVALSSTLDPSYYFGSVPDAPTCVAADGVSGLAGCVVSGYSTAVGTHTVTAKATDNAGHVSVASDTYEVLPWSTKGFYHPVDTTAGVVNGVKGGSTVPVKFELFAGDTELTAVENASFTATKSTCEAGATVDAVEVLASGSTSLRYDATAGQYVYNWKTVKGTGCYSLAMKAKDGTTTAVAKFKTQ